MNKTLAISAIIFGGALAGLSFAGFSGAISKSDDAVAEEALDLSSIDKDQLEKIIENYILENPEVLIVSLNSYTERQREEAAAAQAQAQTDALEFLVSDASAYEAGAAPESASVAVVEFFDYHCGFCKRASGLVQDLTKDDPNVKVVFRELPILRRES